MDPDSLTVQEAATLLVDALLEGAAEYDPALFADADPLLSAITDASGGRRLAELPPDERAAWRALLARAGIGGPDPTGLLGVE